MATPAPAALRSAPPARARLRPSGWSPGTGSLLGAWLASAAIARLTGATAVVLLLAATLVAAVFEIVSGWWSARSIRVRSALAPTIVTVGEHVAVLVSIDGPTPPRASERRRVTLAQPDGTIVSVADATPAPAASPYTDSIAVRFESPGLLSELTASVDVAGPAGLIWWKRNERIEIEPLHVAPVGRGPLLERATSTSRTEGSVAARRGNHGGEIDGVRPWRRGDATNSVHWASSLRTDELIVHDRLTSIDERWSVDLDAAEPDRLRWTLDEARRLGHEVEVRTGDGSSSIVHDADDAARWSAIAAQMRCDHEALDARGRPEGPHVGLMHRPIRLRPAPIEPPALITGPTRWSAAAAAFASLAMLAGALEGSPSSYALLMTAVALGAAVSLWSARRGGRRPLALQALILVAIVAAVAMIGVQVAEVDGLLAALRGPLPDVLMLLVVLHGFEVVDRRTLRVHLAITFVLTSYAAGLRIDAMTGWWLAAWGLPFAASLLTTMRQPRRDAALDPAPPRPRPMGRLGLGSRKVTGRRIVSIVAIGVATLGVLSLIPIPDGPARLGLPAISVDAPSVPSPGGLARPDGSPPSGSEASADRGTIGGVAGYPGFTEALDTSIRGTLSDEIVMRVRAPEPAFWRGQTFTEFDGRTWTVSTELGRSRNGPVIDVRADDRRRDRHRPCRPSELVQTYFVEQDLPNIVFAAQRPVQVIFDGSLWTRPDGALRSDVTLTAGSVYTVVSERIQVDAEILRVPGRRRSGLRRVQRDVRRRRGSNRSWSSRRRPPNARSTSPTRCARPANRPTTRSSPTRRGSARTPSTTSMHRFPPMAPTPSTTSCSSRSSGSANRSPRR